MKRSDVFVQKIPLGLADLWQLLRAAWNAHDLNTHPTSRVILDQFRNAEVAEDIFAAIRQENLLIHHPYELVLGGDRVPQRGGADPQVLAIKQTLYRVGHNSPVVEALLTASERGKQVAVLVELKPRFDEESNIGWARKLEQAGVHVVYGLVGLKTHSKIGDGGAAGRGRNPPICPPGDRQLQLRDFQLL